MDRRAVAVKSGEDASRHLVLQLARESSAPPKGVSKKAVPLLQRRSPGACPTWSFSRPVFQFQFLVVLLYFSLQKWLLFKHVLFKLSISPQSPFTAEGRAGGESCIVQMATLFKPSASTG